MRKSVYEMLNKNTLGVKKCEANQKDHCKQIIGKRNHKL